MKEIRENGISLNQLSESKKGQVISLFKRIKGYADIQRENYNSRGEILKYIESLSSDEKDKLYIQLEDFVTCFRCYWNQEY